MRTIELVGTRFPVHHSLRVVCFSFLPREMLRAKAVLALLAISISLASAQAPEWGQCGVRVVDYFS